MGSFLTGLFGCTCGKQQAVRSRQKILATTCYRYSLPAGFLVMSQAQLASLVGVSQTFLSDLEHNNSAMTEALLNPLEYKAGVNKEWIKTGRGGKFLYLNLNGAESAVSGPEFDADLQSIARALQKIQVKHRSEVTKKVLSFIGLLLNLLKKK